ncbi:putative lactoylglutathione lyase [Herrania umbratica]|uniref:Glyoxalase I n=1 Tax=Herrania umbratica TaxID=108875 RepID=A0A6J1AMW7_9ROSI|nr:putative lactoylglutathione lyase [Herrania umbratica]
MDATFTYQKIVAYKLKMACSNPFTYCFLLFLSLIGSSIAASPSDDLLAWVQQDNRRFLNAVIRVTNLNRTIKFYTENFGMQVLRQSDIPHEKYSYAVLGFGPEDSHFVLQLRQNYGGEKLKLGTAFAHFGIATQDAYKMVEEIRARGGVITREAGPIEGGTTVFAFVQDPDGYMFELIQRPPTPEPLCQLMLHVSDLDSAIQFYEKALGMKLLQKYDSPEEQFAIAMVGYGSNLTQITTVELRYNYNVTEYTQGNGYVQVAINTDDVYRSAAAVKLVSQELGGNITRGPDPISKTTSFLDPDGFETVLVDNRRKKE